MKKFITNIFTLGGIALLALASCKKNDAMVTTDGGTPGALTANTTTLPLDKSRLNDTTSVIVFSSTPPKYSYSAAITVTLQIDSAGDNWKKPTSMTLANKVYKQGFSTATFNNMMLKLNLPAGKASQINVRISYALSSTVVKYSNVLTVSVTPFNLTSWVYVNGSFNGWPNPPSSGPVDSLISVTGNGVYTGIIYFPAGKNDFLLLPQKSSYNNKWATTDAQGTTSATVTQNASNNLYAPATAGYYIITFDSNKGTISFNAADYYSVTGDAATGWGNDTFLKFVNDGNNNWVVTMPLSSSGAFKFRQDAQWTNSWGIPKSGSAGFGVANTLNNTSNDNITVAATGTYKVTFNMAPSAVGSTAVTLATYSVTKQ